MPLIYILRWAIFISVCFCLIFTNEWLIRCDYDCSNPYISSCHRSSLYFIVLFIFILFEWFCEIRQISLRRCSSLIYYAFSEEEAIFKNGNIFRVLKIQLNRDKKTLIRRKKIIFDIPFVKQLKCSHFFVLHVIVERSFRICLVLLFAIINSIIYYDYFWLNICKWLHFYCAPHLVVYRATTAFIIDLLSIIVKVSFV